MNSRAVLLPAALQHFFSQPAQRSQQISSTKCPIPACPPAPDSTLLGSRTHNEFPYEAMGVHRGTPAARHHTLSFFLQGQLKVKGSIWY